MRPYTVSDCNAPSPVPATVADAPDPSPHHFVRAGGEAGDDKAGENAGE